MGFILNETKIGGYYGGQNKKYHDMFDLKADRKFADVIGTEKEAQELKDRLNKNGYNFVVETM